ncbi:MAG: argininosuccinate synthase [Planctomycetota bacterium]|nr:MAG: argininosuccinate synthase [Planctomycetota bacterium]
MAKKASRSAPTPAKPKVVLAYSGGLDTSIIVRWLADRGFDVVCFCANVGQEERYKDLEKKALNSGGSKCIIRDLTEEFVEDFVWPAVAWNARYEGRYLLGTSLARPVIAKHMVEIAKAEGAQYIAHGATGKGNDQIRFELTAYALMPGVKIIAPWRDPEFNQVIKGRAEAIAYAKEHGIPITASKKEPWSSDENLLHISYEAGELEDPNRKPRESMYKLTAPVKKVRAASETVTIDFAAGIPVAINGKKRSPAALLTEANRLGFKHGIGRIDIVESRFVGMKSRGVYETPGGSLLMAAHEDLETLCIGRDLLATKAQLAVRFSQLAYNGFWYCEEMEALQAFLDSSQRQVSGRVTLELYRGNIIVVGRTSPNSLYDEDIASMDDDHGAYDQSDATGFIRLQALPLRVAAQRAGKQQRTPTKSAKKARVTKTTKKQSKKR